MHADFSQYTGQTSFLLRVLHHHFTPTAPLVLFSLPNLGSQQPYDRFPSGHIQMFAPQHVC